MTTTIPENFVAEAEATCQCGATVIVGRADGAPCVLHSLPTCSDYESRDPVDYLWWLNEVQGRHTKGATA